MEMGGYAKRLLREAPKAAIQAVLGAIGFLLALLVNQWVEDGREMAAYRALLGTLRAEADYNNDVMLNHFDVLIPNHGLPLTEFNTTTSVALLSNPTFARHATAGQISVIGSYDRDLMMANGLRRILESVTLTAPANEAEWQANILTQWRKQRQQLGADLGAVQMIAAGRCSK